MGFSCSKYFPPYIYPSPISSYFLDSSLGHHSPYPQSRWLSFCAISMHLQLLILGEKLRSALIIWVLDKRLPVRGSCMLFGRLKSNRGHYSLATGVERLVERYKMYSCFLLSVCGPLARGFRLIKLLAASLIV